MNLNFFIGPHMLSGVDMDGDRAERDDDSSRISFVLNGKTYTAVEDPDDGYRSIMAEIKESGYQVKNTFEPVPVLISLDSEETAILNFKCVDTGADVLRVGTDYSDDHYPVCVMRWMPENLPTKIGAASTN